MATEKTAQPQTPKTCGIIMPISPHEDYLPSHWEDVLKILKDAISKTDFISKLVSDDVAAGLIHERIVTNIYGNDIIVCDVSTKNPNVMFELGMRLAFDKPVIIIKDENTDYSFDTAAIEHLSYPSTLRFNLIEKFKTDLVNKIIATHNKSQTDPNYSPFLKSFSQTIVTGKLQSKEVSESKFIMEKMEALSREVRLLRLENRSALSIGASRRFLNMKDDISDAAYKYFSEEDIKPKKELSAEAVRKISDRAAMRGVRFDDSNEETP